MANGFGQAATFNSDGFGTGSAFGSSLSGTMSEPAWLVRARTFIGFHETGNNRGIEEFISEAKTGSLGDPWCAIFANAMLESVGVRGTRSPAARSFEDNANFSSTQPIVGCIVTFWRVSPDSGQGHVGFFLGQDANNVQLLSGNDDDQVEIAPHPRSRVTGYWWPNGVTIQPQPWPDPTVSSGRGSCYSQYSGKYNWVDRGDRPNSNALGVPDSAQGCAFYNRSTLGHWFVVTAPNGKSLLMPQTDIGPSPTTHRAIDISAHMAEAFGYTPTTFPTDSIFTWVPAPPPPGLEGLPPKQQAIQWANGPIGGGPDPLPKPDNNLLLILLLMMLSKDKLMVDGPAKMLLPLLLQSALRGTQVDINALLPQLLYPQLGVMPADGVTKPPAPSNTPVLSKPSVQLSVAGLGLSTILQALGFVGTPFGMGQNPSDYGTLATLVPIITAAIGATGGFGALGSIASGLLSAFRRPTT
jgi:uncharacterized protein (TIGR02594 family)